MNNPNIQFDPSASFDPNDKEDREKILSALRNPSFLWRTVQGIAKETNIPQDRVQRLLISMTDEVVLPHAVTPSGQQLFGSRQHVLQNSSSLANTISGVFGNRIY